MSLTLELSSAGLSELAECPEGAADLVTSLGRVADAVAAGDITPDEGQAVSAVLETKRRAIETLELETRIKALEKERIK